jgi:hypothetical protein
VAGLLGPRACWREERGRATARGLPLERSAGGPHAWLCREVQTAIRLVFPGELAKHAVSEGTKAVTKSRASGGNCQSTCARGPLWRVWLHVAVWGRFGGWRGCARGPSAQAAASGRAACSPRFSNSSAS